MGIPTAGLGVSTTEPMVPPGAAGVATPPPSLPRANLSFWRPNLSRDAERLGWVIAAVVVGTVALWIYFIQLRYPVPPGGDPGNWISISYAYIGGQYPGQVNPYGYPPLLFPLLGSLVILTGSPLAAGHAIIPILVALFGFSVYVIARTILRSVVLSLAVVAFILLDPAFMALFFWGALPNILALVFMNLSLVGLILLGRGRITRGAYCFWGFAAATVLTHSLVGVALAASVALTVVLAAMAQPPDRTTIRQAAEGGKLDSPAVMLRAMFLSRAGQVGALAFGASVGGWYLATWRLGIPHPGYFTPSPGSTPAGYGAILRNLLPGLRMTPIGTFYSLVFLEIFLFFIFAYLLVVRPYWVRTSPVVLISVLMGIPATAIVGWLLSISTDYHRFGFLLVTPVALSIAYLVDRILLSPAPAAAPLADADMYLPRERRSVRTPLFPIRYRTSYTSRLAVVGVVVVVLVVVLTTTVTAPAYNRFERAFAGSGHDQQFLQALGAIQHSGLPGSVLTVRGDIKWTWAITHRSAYAPRPGDAFLFYPAQIRDSALAYYALSTHYAVTNGLVATSVSAGSTAYASGIPEYEVYQGGGLASTIRLDPKLLVVSLRSPTGTLNVPLSGPLSYTPPTGPGLPSTVVYNDPRFVLTESITVPPGIPGAYLNVSVIGKGVNSVTSVTEVLVGPPLLSASAALTQFPGTFAWQTQGLKYRGLTTQGFVFPPSGLQGVSTYYPASGGSAVVLQFNTSVAGPTGAVGGSVLLVTPSAAGHIPDLPWLIDTPAVWQGLNVQFILYPNSPSFSLYPGSFLTNETRYLETEFGCHSFYSNNEWIILLAPSTGGSIPAVAGVPGP